MPLDALVAPGPPSGMTKEDEEKFKQAIAIQFDVSVEMLQTLRRTVAPPDATLEDIAMYLATCRRLNLDPFTRQIFLLKIRNRNILQIGIDGMFSIAEQSKEYDGCDAPVYAYEADGSLKSATVRVYRRGMSHGVQATALWREYAFYQEPNSAWVRMPHHMLGIAAYRVALRRAFPRTLSGLYGPEETEAMAEEARPASPPQAPRLAAGAPPLPGTTTASVRPPLPAGGLTLEALNALRKAEREAEGGLADPDVEHLISLGIDPAVVATVVDLWTDRYDGGPAPVASPMPSSPPMDPAAAAALAETSGSVIRAIGEQRAEDTASMRAAGVDAPTAEHVAMILAEDRKAVLDAAILPASAPATKKAVPSSPPMTEDLTI